MSLRRSDSMCLGSSSLSGLLFISQAAPHPRAVKNFLELLKKHRIVFSAELLKKIETDRTFFRSYDMIAHALLAARILNSGSMFKLKDREDLGLIARYCESARASGKLSESKFDFILAQLKLVALTPEKAGEMLTSLDEAFDGSSLWFRAEAKVDEPSIKRPRKD